MKVQVVPVLCPQCGNTIPLDVIRTTFFSCPSCNSTLIIEGLTGDDIPQEIGQLIEQGNLSVAEPKLHHQFLYGITIFVVSLFILMFIQAFVTTVFNFDPDLECAIASFCLVLALILTSRRRAKFNDKYGL